MIKRTCPICGGIIEFNYYNEYYFCNECDFIYELKGY